MMVNEERKRLKTTKCEVFSYPMHGELKTVKESKKRQERYRNIGLSSQPKNVIIIAVPIFGFPWWQVWKKDGRIRRIMEMGKNVKPCDGDEDSDEDKDDDVDDGDGDGDVYDGEFYSQIWYIFVLGAAGDRQGGQQVQGDGGCRQGFDQTYDLQHFAIGTRKE